MRKYFLLLLLLIFTLVGCGINENGPVDETVVVTAVPDSPNTSIPPSPDSTDTPAPTDPPTPLPTITPSPVPPDLSITAENVHLYPVPSLYAGDLVTFQILAHVPENMNPQDVTVHILVDYQPQHRHRSPGQQNRGAVHHLRCRRSYQRRRENLQPRSWPGWQCNGTLR